MRNTFLSLLGALALGFLSCGQGADAPKKIQVLIITGDDVSPAHNWLEVTTATRGILNASGKFEVKVCEDAGILDSAASIARYDVLYMAMFNAKTPTLSDQAKSNLVAFVKGGKGFVVTHLSSASFKEWPEFRKLCGRVWVMGTSGHGPRSLFKVDIAKPDHSIVQGVTEFEADDELYAKLQGSDPIEVLATAKSDWSKQTEPMAFVLNYGQGRVFHHTFGHDGKALNNPSIGKLIQRGTEWAAKGRIE